MSCDRETLLLISSYADGETTPGEAERAQEHLASCTACRKLVEQWQGHRQLLTWAYTREIPDEITADELIRLAERETFPPMKKATTHQQVIPPSLILKWRWVGVLAASILLAVFIYQYKISPTLIKIGQEVIAADASATKHMTKHITIEVGQHSKVRRIDKQTIRLEQGWVAVSVEQGSGVTVLTPRLKVTDRGTRFHVGIGSKAEYVTVEKGAVDVTLGEKTRAVNAGQAMLADGAGVVSMLTIPEPEPWDKDNGKPLREYNPEFMPSAITELERIEGTKRLAARFPDVLTTTLIDGSTSTGNDQDWVTYVTGVGGQREAMREHLAEIAQIITGGRAGVEEWEIPVAVMQIIGFEKESSLADDVYYLRIISKDDAFSWRFTGSHGQQVDIPVSFETVEEEDTALPDHSLNGMLSETTFRPNNDIRYIQKYQMLRWPQAAKPTLILRINGPQKLPIWTRDQAMTADIARQFEGEPDIKMSKSAYINVLYLDPQRKHRMLFAGNENSGKQLCELYEQVQKGRGGSVVVGVLATDSPLTEPPADKGIYLVRFAWSGSSLSPYLELTTPDKRYVAAWKGPSYILKKNGPPNNKIESSTHYQTNTPPNYGNLGLELSRMPSQQDDFPMRIQVTGHPSDIASRERKEGGGTSRLSPEGEWATGWIRIKKP